MQKFSSVLEGLSGDKQDPLANYRPWFYAAALYNALWGFFTILFPQIVLQWVHIQASDAVPLWQCIGMFVLVYAPAYWWAGRYPARYRHLILVGLIGKILGPIGFIWAYLHGQLPLAFGLINLTNDLIWWPAFIRYLHAGARLSGGWIPFVLGQ